MNKFERHELGEAIGWLIVIAGPFVGFLIVAVLSFFE